MTMMPTQFADNDDGITVVDVTEGSGVRYAFVSLPSSFHDPHIQRFTPLSADGYMTACASSEDVSWPEERGRLQLHDVPLIDADALQSTWPKLQFKDGDSLSENSKTLDESEVKQALSTLRGKIMHDTIMTGLDGTPDELSWLLDAEQLPEFRNTVQDMLYADPALLEKPSGQFLLERCLQGQSVINLRPFSTMRTSQLLDIMYHLKQNITLLLPTLNDMEIGHLAQLLDNSKIRVLLMGETPKMNLQQIMDSLAGHPLDEFSHPSLYRLTTDMYATNPDLHPAMLPKYPSGTAPGYPASQMIYMRYDSRDTDDTSQLAEGGLRWMDTWKAVAKGPDNPSGERQIWNYDTGPNVVPISLRSSLLSLDQVLEKASAISVYLSRRLSFRLAGMMQLSRTGKEVAYRLAKSATDNVVLPLPAELYNSYKTFSHDSSEPPPEVYMPCHGEWTLLVLHEETPNYSGLCYRFITLDEQAEVVSSDVSSFEHSLVASNEIYEPRDKAAREELVNQFEQKLVGKGSGCRYRPDLEHLNLGEVEEALKLVALYREQREANGPGDHSRKWLYR